MTIVRTYRMTISTAWYDEEVGQVREFEAHFKVARRGKIQTIRRYLVKRGLPYFQRVVYRLTGRWPPKHKLRVSFEREEPALKPEKDIFIQMRSMQYVGPKRRWKAFALPSRVLSYVKRRRKRKR